MAKTQAQIPDELFARAKQVAAAKERSFAEIVRRGLESMTAVNPAPSPHRPSWRLPKPRARLSLEHLAHCRGVAARRRAFWFVGGA